MRRSIIAESKVLDSRVLSALSILSEVACRNRVEIYLVGGIARDIIYGKRSLDIDIVSLKDAVKIGRSIESEGAGRLCRISEAFKTCRVEIMGQSFDIATSRSESYPKRGQLPRIDKFCVELKLDLLRRDFTINSLAISLNQKNYFEIIDPLSSMNDLKDKLLRVHHANSFIDDPTRILRLLKFKSRFGLKIESETLNLMRSYICGINVSNVDICKSRMKNELIDTLNLNRIEIYRFFMKEKLYNLIFKKFREVEICEDIEFLKETIDLYKDCIDNVWLILILVKFTEFEFNFELTKIERKIVEDFIYLKNNVKKCNTNIQIYKKYKGLETEAILSYYIINRDKNESIKYLKELKSIEIGISGKDLILLGLKPCYKFKKILELLKLYKIEVGYELTKEEQIEFVKKNYESCEK